MEPDEKTPMTNMDTETGDEKEAIPEENNHKNVEEINQNGKTNQNHTDAATAKEKEALLNEADTAALPGIEFKVQAPPAPKDKFMIVYMILLLHGVGTLMPWNMFITATNYFTEYKLLGPACEIIGQNFTTVGENITSAAQFGYDRASETLMTFANSTADPNGTVIPECQETSSLYRNYFLSYLGFVAQIPNVLLNAINVFAHVSGGSTSKRIIWSIIIIIIMFIVTVVLAMIDSSAWPDIFFWVTMVTVVIINMANGVYQNSVYGTAAVLPMKYTNAVVLGSNISGTLASAIMLISIAATPNIRVSAIYYFLTAIFILLIAFDTYFALPLLPFFCYHKERADKQKEIQDQKCIDESRSSRPPYLYIFQKCWKQFMGVWLVFFVTLTCFPAIQAGVQRVEGDRFPIPVEYFTPVTCFLFFNVFAMLGNLTTEFIKKPGPRWVWLPIVLRLLFIPFFMLCNFIPKSGQRAMPILISNNWVYTIGGIIMAFTSGYLSSLTMMYAPRELKEPEYQGIAGMMAAFFLISGIFCGVIFSLPVTMMVEYLG